jgi:hypothetical protein
MNAVASDRAATALFLFSDYCKVYLPRLRMTMKQYFISIEGDPAAWIDITDELSALDDYATAYPEIREDLAPIIGLLTHAEMRGYVNEDVYRQVHELVEAVELTVAAL